MPEPSPEQVVDAINDISGVHPGHRAAHAKGTLCAGHVHGDAGGGRAHARRAHAGRARAGDGALLQRRRRPRQPDYATEGRGMAVKLYLDDGARTDMVALSLPVFFARTPEDFLEFTRARKPDPATGQPDMEKLGTWLGEHPEAGPAIQAAVTAPPPASYAQCDYNGIHAFRWMNADGEEPLRPLPLGAGGGRRGPLARGGEGARRRLPAGGDPGAARRRAGAAFRLVVTLAELGDPVDDPTEAWPRRARDGRVGRLELTGPETERERDGDVLVFDPTRVVDGIELTEDPILRFRPAPTRCRSSGAAASRVA